MAISHGVLQGRNRESQREREKGGAMGGDMRICMHMHVHILMTKYLGISYVLVRGWKRERQRKIESERDRER